MLLYIYGESLFSEDWRQRYEHSRWLLDALALASSFMLFNSSRSVAHSRRFTNKTRVALRLINNREISFVCITGYHFRKARVFSISPAKRLSKRHLSSTTVLPKHTPSISISTLDLENRVRASATSVISKPSGSRPVPNKRQCPPGRIAA